MANEPAGFFPMHQKVPSVLPRLVDTQFRCQWHFELSAENGWTADFTIRAPKHIENGRACAICIMKMDVGQFTCNAHDLQIYLQLDAAHARTMYVSSHPDTDVDFAFPVTPYNGILPSATVYAGIDPARYDVTTQHIVGRFGPYESAAAAMSTLRFDDADCATTSTANSPIVWVAKEDKVSLNGKTRKQVLEFCEGIDKRMVQVARQNAFICGVTRVRLLLLPPFPDDTKAPATGSVTFQCLGKRVDLIATK